MVKKSLLLGTLALAVAGGAVAVSGVVTGPAGIASAADASSTAGASAKGVKGQQGPLGEVLKTVAQILNITPQELLKDLRSGQSISQVAQSKGVAEQQVIDAIVQDLSASIDKRVQAGKLTQEKADQLKAGLADRVKQMVEHQGPWKKEGYSFQRASLKEIATILGMSQQDLVNQLKSGQSIVDVAQSKGISEEQLIDQLLQKEKDALTKFVERTWGSHKASGSGAASGDQTAQQSQGTGSAGL